MKTEHIQKQLDFFVRDKTHHAYRRPAEDAHALAETFAAQGLDDMQRSVARLRYVLEKETPVVFPDERITLLRTVRTIPELHTEEEDRQLHETHAFHENGRVFNMCPDYGMLMADGFTKKAEAIRAQLAQAETAEQMALTRRPGRLCVKRSAVPLKMQDIKPAYMQAATGITIICTQIVWKTIASGWLSTGAFRCIRGIIRCGSTLPGAVSTELPEMWI